MSLVYLTNIKVNSWLESNNYGLFLSGSDLYVFTGRIANRKH